MIDLNTPKQTLIEILFKKKQVTGVGGLTLLAIKDYILHIYVRQSHIMQFLYLKLFFYFAGNPLKCSFISGSIKNRVQMPRELLTETDDVCPQSKI